MFTWHAQTLQWLARASRYTGFHDKLARLLLPSLTPGGTLADLGCGAGLLDLALSPHMGRITCVDRSEEALHFLRTVATAQGRQNIETRAADAFTLTGRWDHVCLTFFGSLAQHHAHYLSLCDKTVVAVVRADAAGHLGPAGHHPAKRSTVATTAAALDVQGVPHTFTEHTLEYGQPLQSHAEAEAFVRAYSPGITDEALRAYLAENLTRTGNPHFPLYLPNPKRFGIFILRRHPYDTP